MLWFGRSDPCNSAGKVAARDARVTPPLQRADLQQLLSSNSLPTCGGVGVYHLPKSAGSSVECFLGAQPHFACCYRTTCGFCRTSARGGQCQHRGLLPSGLRSRWADSPQGRNVTPFFVLPTDLLRLSPRAEFLIARFFARCDSSPAFILDQPAFPPPQVRSCPLFTYVTQFSDQRAASSSSPLGSATRRASSSLRGTITEGEETSSRLHSHEPVHCSA